VTGFTLVRPGLKRRKTNKN